MPTARLDEPWHARGVSGTVPLPEQPSIDVVDESFIRVERAVLARAVAERWSMWWPDLRMEIYMDRGLEGLRWTVTGALVGTSEIWLEEHAPGVIVHYYLRAEPTIPGSSTTARPATGNRRTAKTVADLQRRHVLAWKRVVWSLKDELEADARSHRQ